MDENIKAVRRERWRKVVMTQKASGLTITEWCEQNGIRARQFHYWQKILRDNALPEMQPDQINCEELTPACVPAPTTSVQVFAEVPVAPQNRAVGTQEERYSELCGLDSGILIQCQDLQIRIRDNFSERALIKVLQVIRNA